jgi:hypothetical protein
LRFASPRTLVPSLVLARGRKMGTARFSSPTRHGLLAASAAAVSVGLFLFAASSYAQTTPTGDTTIRPFKIQVPQAALDDLRRRIAATRWPDKETVDDRSEGAQLAKLQELVQYWGSGYDWRKVEARLKALPQFTTNIDGVDIHFIHVRSRHKNALPLIITHGWPGSIIEQLKVSSVRSRIQPPTEAAPRTLSMSSSGPCRATASPASRQSPAGIRIT